MVLFVSKKSLIILISLAVALVISIAIYVSFNAPNDPDSYKVIETNDGLVRGQLKRTQFHGKQYYAFQGIPYAKPPVGELRFKAPEPIGSWAPSILDAFQYRNACLQDPTLKTIYGIGEDCLHLNIFVPVGGAEEIKKAVMFHIHGGGYFGNSADDYLCGPDFLMEQDIILVTSNFRLGIFGFLNLKTPEISGNMGLKDQQLALKWIHENIHYFGGDPNRITLSGHSSGSRGNTLHVINPESNKYISRHISMSGVFNEFQDLNYDRFFDQLYEVAEKLSHPVNNCSDLIEILQNATADKLFEHTKKFNWRFTIENKNAIRPFFTEHPMILFDKSECMNVTSLYGFLDLEESRIVDKKIQKAIWNNFDESFFSWCHLNVKFDVNKVIHPSKAFKRSLNNLKEFYFGNETYDFNDGQSIEQFFWKFFEIRSNFKFMYPIQKTIKHLASKSCKNTYAYEFLVNSNLNFQNKKFGFSAPGALHVDEQYYIFWARDHEDEYRKVFETKDTDEQSRISYNTIMSFTNLLANFVKYGTPIHDGQPTPVFEPTREDEIKLLKISNEGMSFTGSLDEKKIQLWDEFFKQLRMMIDMKFIRNEKNRQCKIN